MTAFARDPLSTVDGQVNLVNTHWGMNNQERLKQVEAIRDLIPILESIEDYIKGSLRLIGSRVNGFGNWDAKLDVMIQFQDENLDNILNKIEIGCKLSKDFVVLGINFSDGNPNVKVCHIMSGLDLCIMVSTNVLVYSNRLKNSFLLSAYGRQNPEFAKAFLTYKWLFKRTNMFDEENEGMSTYGHLVLFINFLRQKSLVEFIDPLNLTLSIGPETKRVKYPASALLIKFLGYISTEDVASKVIIMHKDPLLCYYANPGGKLDIRALYYDENIAATLTPLNWRKYKKACQFLFHVLRNQDKIDDENRLGIWGTGSFQLGPDGLASVKLGKIQKQVTYICENQDTLYQ